MTLLLALLLAAAPEARQRPELHPTRGPATIDLGHDLSLELPADFAFVNKDEGRKFMEYLGNREDDRFAGIVFKRGANWMVNVSYEDSGYVKDDEAAKLDAKAILDAIREGTNAANEERRKQGIPAIDVVGWAEEPRYEVAAHHVVWAVEGKDPSGHVVNFNTRVLGRRGVASLNLIASPDELPAAKPNVATLLAATSFKPGSRYEVFDKSHDKVAEFGLAALVAGGAGAAALKLVKIGLLAKFGKLILAGLIAGKKALVALIVAAWAAMKRFFGRKKAETDAPPPPAPAP